jgi:pimeloyl-ACP methyl ester carboxylesterase
VQFFEYQGKKLFYTTCGSGEALILLHGFGEDGNTWQNQIEALQNHYSILIPHLPGSNKSELIVDMSIAGMANAIFALTRFVFGNVQINFMGHSMGGYIGLHLASQHASMLKSFALIHSTAFADSPEKISMRQKAIEFIDLNGAAAFLKTSIPGLFINEQHPACIQLLNKAGNFNKSVLIAYYNAMINRAAQIELLKTMPCKILFLIGEHDKAVPLHQSLQQCYLPNLSHVHILRNSAHMGICEEAEKVNLIFTEFLSSVI